MSNTPKFLEFESHPLEDAFFKACRYGYVKKIKDLIKQGFDVNYKNFTTPLNIACHKNKLNVINILLENGADIEQKDFKGENPLIIACLKENIPLMEHLIKNGADIHVKNIYNANLMVLIGLNNKLKSLAYFFDTGLYGAKEALFLLNKKHDVGNGSPVKTEVVQYLESFLQSQVLTKQVNAKHKINKNCVL